MRAHGWVVGVNAAMLLLPASASAGAAETPPSCTPDTCVPAPRWDSAYGRGISAANTIFEIAAFGGPSGEEPHGRIFVGGIYRNSTGTLTCAKVSGRVAVGGFRIVSSDDPMLVGTGLLAYGVDNGRTPPGHAVDQGNAFLVPQAPTSCPEPDAAKANIDLCGELTIRDARPGGPALVPRLKVKPPTGRPCNGPPAGVVVSRPVAGARVRVPAVVGRQRRGALCTLARFGLRWRFRGFPRVYRTALSCNVGVSPDPTILKQSPRAGTRVPSGHVVVLDDDCVRRARRGTRTCA
jgi:hypothetical protein